MPITIKSTEIKYKNPTTGQYQGVDAVAEMTTSEQCALIEAKGEETIASIPSDYTTLSNTVGDLNTALNAEASAIAIVSNGNTHIAITSGQYVYVKGHGTLSEGLYVAKSNISANATLSTSNLDAATNGGLNQITPISLGGTGAATAREAVGNLIGNQNFYSFYVSVPTDQHKIIRLRGTNTTDYVIRGLLCIGGVDNIKGCYLLNKSSIGQQSNVSALVPYSGAGSVTVSVVSQGNGGIAIDVNTSGLSYSLYLSFIMFHLNKPLDSTFPVIEDAT